MAEPTVAETDDGGGEMEEPDSPDDPLDDAEEMAAAEADAPEPEGEPNVAEAELSDDDLSGDAGDLFTGTEEADVDGDDGDEESADESDESGEDSDALDGLGERGESMEEAINEGAGRLGVLGLDDGDEKDDLEAELTEVFGAFRLGYFGSRFMEEYIFTDDEDEVDPMWGLFGAALCCVGVVVWMRPDGEEMVETARDAVENIAGGSL